MTSRGGKKRENKGKNPSSAISEAYTDVRAMFGRKMEIKNTHTMLSTDVHFRLRMESQAIQDHHQGIINVHPPLMIHPFWLIIIMMLMSS